MLDILRPKLNRRQFLSAGLAIAGGAALMSPRRVFGGVAGDRSEVVRWALLSDTHTPHDPGNRFGGFYPYRNLKEAVGRISVDMPDRLLVAGDVARLTGSPGSYDSFKKLMAPIAAKRPIHLVVGNHDDRDNFRQAFENYTGDWAQMDGKHVVAANAGPVRMILLDSLLWVNLFPGQLGQMQRLWLETYLRASDETPTILFVHHTINDGANDMMDAGQLVDIIGPMTKVKAVVFGHSHACSFSELHGIHLINVPALGFTFSAHEPIGWIDAQLTARGGEFTVRAIGGNRRLDGYVKRLSWRT
jgi:Icc protein